jgi:hypothetical protein
MMDLVPARFVNPLTSTARNSRGFSSTPVAGTEWNAVPFAAEVFLPAGNYLSGIAAGIVDVPPAENVGHWLVRIVPEPSLPTFLLRGAVVCVFRRRPIPKSSRL